MTPVMNEASAEARNRMAAATSLGSPIRPIGCIRSIAARYSMPPGSSGKRITRSVRIVPGATALTRIPRSVHSIARCLAIPEATNLAGPLALLPLDSGDRGETDDRPATGRQHRLDGVLAGQPHTAPIDGHHLVPVL